MTGEATYRVYVDSRPIDVPVTATVIDAVELADPAFASEVRSGTRSVTDSRGLPISTNAPLHGGAILRVVSARQRES